LRDGRHQLLARKQQHDRRLDDSQRGGLGHGLEQGGLVDVLVLADAADLLLDAVRGGLHQHAAPAGEQVETLRRLALPENDLARLAGQRLERFADRVKLLVGEALEERQPPDVG
jgi:hypothetical protein